jgi:hypothetical protein
MLIITFMQKKKRLSFLSVPKKVYKRKNEAHEQAKNSEST